MLALKRLYKDGVPGYLALTLEGGLAALVGTGFGMWLFPDETSIVCVFLASILTIDSIERLLNWNRRAIFELGYAPGHANVRLVLLILAMFAGTMLGFSALTFWLPLETVEQVFSHQLAEYGSQTFPELTFGTPWLLFSSNLYVLLFFFLIAMPFRQGGVMLAVAWNASVWGATFGILARRWAEAGGPPLLDAYARVMTATVPHMTLEAAAFVLAGFAGVFMSKGLLKYSMEDAVLASILGSVARMMGAALLLVAVGALWEGWVAGWLVRLLSGG